MSESEQYDQDQYGPLSEGEQYAHDEAITAQLIDTYGE